MLGVVHVGVVVGIPKSPFLEESVIESDRVFAVGVLWFCVGFLRALHPVGFQVLGEEVLLERLDDFLVDHPAYLCP